MVIEIRNDRQIRALTGLTQAQFEQLLRTFNERYQAKRQADYEQAVQAGQRRRQLGGGRKSKLPTLADKLLFILYYYKTYPTFDGWGPNFSWRVRRRIPKSISSHRSYMKRWWHWR